MLSKIIYRTGLTLSLVGLLLTAGCRASVELGKDASIQQHPTHIWMV